MTTETFFAGWSGLASVLISAVVAYPALVLVLRISGKRTLSKLNAFDLVVTVALGSTLATVITSKDVALLEGLLALFLLVFFQYVVTFASVRSGVVDQVSRANQRFCCVMACPLPRR